jgi:hypothetical protein
MYHYRGKLPVATTCSYRWLCALYRHHLSSTSRLLATVPSPLLSLTSLISDMSQSYSTFQALFNAALQDYKDKTGNSLIDHPFARQLETCESVNSITAILQEQAKSFREFRENEGRLMKALNSSVISCACPLSTPPSARQSVSSYV